MSNEERGSTSFTRRIGTTTYKVRVFFDDKEGDETVGDRILRLIKNEVLASEAGCGTMDSPQTSRQSERSA